MIYLFIYIDVLWLAWFYMTWQLCVAMKVWKKPLQAKSQGRFFTIINWELTTLIMTDMGIYSMVELYVSLKNIHVSLCIRSLFCFSSCLGNHLPYSNSFIMEKNVHFLRECEGFSSEQSANIPNYDLCRCGSFLWTVTTKVLTITVCRICSTVFKHFWQRVWWPCNKVI